MGTSILLFCYPGWGGSTVRADPTGKYGPARLLWETRGELVSCNKKAAPSPGTADKTNYDEPAIVYCTLPEPGKFFVRHIQAGLLAQALSQLPPSQGLNTPVAYGSRIANTATALRGILTRFPFNAPKGAHLHTTLIQLLLFYQHLKSMSRKKFEGPFSR